MCVHVLMGMKGVVGVEISTEGVQVKMGIGYIVTRRLNEHRGSQGLDGLGRCSCWL